MTQSKIELRTSSSSMELGDFIEESFQEVRVSS